MTDLPSRFGAQLAEQLGHEFETEWSAEAGFVKLPDGVCDMHSWPEGLRLDAFAPSAEKLSRVQDTVGQQLARGKLTVEWQRRPSSR